MFAAIETKKPSNTDESLLLQNYLAFSPSFRECAASHYLPPPRSVYTTRYLALLVKNFCPDDGATPPIFGILGFQRAVPYGIYLRVAPNCHGDLTSSFRI